MAEFLLKFNYFEFNSNVKHQISGIGTTGIIGNNWYYLELELLELRLPHQMHVYIWTTWRISFSKMSKFDLVQFRCIVDTFFIWTASECELGDFLERLNNFHPDLNFTHERSRQEIDFLDDTVRVNQGEFITNLYCKLADDH